MPRITAPALITLVSAMFEAVGSSAPEAARIAGDLVEANLRGHDSHGVQLVPRYIENAEAGLIN
ncbi:MAG: malate dehydrogenase, partial [Rhodospirillales bacterium]|nr:malate dehydrogenase [Rhodospirillales bacterium]